MRTCLPDLGPCGARQVPRDVAGLVLFLVTFTSSAQLAARSSSSCGTSWKIAAQHIQSNGSANAAARKRFHLGPQELAKSHMNVFTEISTHSLHMDIVCGCWLEEGGGRWVDGRFSLKVGDRVVVVAAARQSRLPQARFGPLRSSPRCCGGGGRAVHECWSS